MKMSHPLRALSLFVTEACNLDCSYCFSGKRNRGEIAFHTARKAVDFLLEQSENEKSLDLTFFGGEPLLSLGLLDRLVEYTNREARRAGKTVRYSMPTNCTLFDRNTLSFILNRNIFLSLSIDGARRSQSLRRTGDGRSSFPVVRKNIERIKSEGMHELVKVRKTVTPQSAGDLYEDILYFLGHGLRNITFSPVMEVQWPEPQLELFEQQQMRVAEHWVRCLDAAEPFSIQLWDEMLAERVFGKRPDFFCQAGVSMLAVDITGRLFPCHRFVYYDQPYAHHCLGDVFAGLSSDSLNTTYTGVTRDVLMNRTKSCATCIYSDRCRLYCPAVNYKLTGDTMRNPPWLCRFQVMCERVADFILESVQDETKLTAYLRSSSWTGRIDGPWIEEITNKAQDTLKAITTKQSG